MDKPTILMSGTGANGKPITINLRHVVSAQSYGDADSDIELTNDNSVRVHLAYDAFVEGWNRFAQIYTVRPQVLPNRS